MARNVLRVLAAITTAITLIALAHAPAYADETVEVTGVVFSSTPGSTVTDACVTLFQADTAVEVATGCIDSAGEFTIPVTPDTYKVRIRATGFPEQWYGQSSTFERATRLDVSAGGGALIFVGLVGGFADITGRIVNSDGAPVENATVTATGVASGRQRSATTDANGDYAILDLEPGPYTVFIQTNDLGSQWAFATKAFAEAAIFDLIDGEVRVVNDTMLPLSTVEVVMVDEKSHKRLTRGCVRVGDRPGGETCENVNGVFTVSGVPAGDYEVSAEPEGTHWPATKAVTVEAGRTQRITIVVERATAFVTTVKESATGKPAAGVCVQLAEPKLTTALFIHGCSTADGRLVIGPLEGRVRAQLFALHLEDRYGAQWVGTDGGTGDQRKARFFTAENDVATAIPPLRVDPPGSISGVVRDQATGNPLRNVCAFPFGLSSTDALDRQVGPHCSDATGRFTINGLGPYAWPVLHIAVFQTQYAWLWSGGASDRFAARYIQVRAGETSDADVSMVPAGTITGQAFTPSGEPTSANAIVAHNVRTGDLAGPPTSSGFGSYTLRTLATQEVRVEYTISDVRCWYNAQRNERNADPVHVQSGSATTGIDLIDCSG